MTDVDEPAQAVEFGADARRRRRKAAVDVAITMLVVAIAAALTIPNVHEFGATSAVLVWTCAALLWALFMVVWSGRGVRIVIGPAQVRLVGSWRTYEIDPGDVALIIYHSEKPVDDKAEHLQLRAGRKLWRIELRGEEAECAAALRSACPNAVYIDPGGVEHMPHGSRRPVTVLANLVRERRRRALREILGGALLSTGAGVLIGFAILGEDGDGLWHALRPIAAFLVGLYMCFSGVRQLRRARRLAWDRQRVIEGGIADKE
ncbi:MAG: hypothetical protein ACOC8E_06550 [Planctomycetota bacterium]